MADPSSSGSPVPAIRRAFTLPTKLTDNVEQPRSRSKDQNPQQTETLFVHHSARIINFNTTGFYKSPSRRRESIDSNATLEEENPGTLPWRTQTERLLATGPITVYKVPGSAAFLNSGAFLKPVLAKSQCWCVDGETIFVLKRGLHDFYRIELPNEAEHDRLVAVAFGEALDQILRYEKTPCPFKREFHVELPEGPNITYVPWKPKHRPISLIRRADSESPCQSPDRLRRLSSPRRLNDRRSLSRTSEDSTALSGTIDSTPEQSPSSATRMTNQRSIKPTIGKFETIDQAHERDIILSRSRFSVSENNRANLDLDETLEATVMSSTPSFPSSRTGTDGVVDKLQTDTVFQDSHAVQTSQKRDQLVSQELKDNPKDYVYMANDSWKTETPSTTQPDKSSNDAVLSYSSADNSAFNRTLSTSSLDPLEVKQNILVPDVDGLSSNRPGKIWQGMSKARSGDVANESGSVTKEQALGSWEQLSTRYRNVGDESLFPSNPGTGSLPVLSADKSEKLDLREEKVVSGEAPIVISENTSLKVSQSICSADAANLSYICTTESSSFHQNRGKNEPDNSCFNTHCGDGLEIKVLPGETLIDPAAQRSVRSSSPGLFDSNDQSNLGDLGSSESEFLCSEIMPKVENAESISSAAQEDIGSTSEAAHINSTSESFLFKTQDDLSKPQYLDDGDVRRSGENDLRLAEKSMNNVILEQNFLGQRLQDTDSKETESHEGLDSDLLREKAENSPLIGAEISVKPLWNNPVWPAPMHEVSTQVKNADNSCSTMDSISSGITSAKPSPSLSYVSDLTKFPEAVLLRKGSNNCENSSRYPAHFQSNGNSFTQPYEHIGAIIGRKVAGVFFGPPLQLAAIMLRVAARLTDGIKIHDESGEGWKRRTETGRRLPGTWEYYDKYEGE